MTEVWREPWGDPWALAALALALVAVVQSLRLWWVRGIAARRMNRHRRLGAQGEREAEALLTRAGYEIVGRQAAGSYRLAIDDRQETIHLRADYLVRPTRGLLSRQANRLYVAEVKSGLEAAKITGRATRRQLLEYLTAFDVDGVLLVDVARRRISAIRFP